MLKLLKFVLFEQIKNHAYWIKQFRKNKIKTYFVSKNSLKTINKMQNSLNTYQGYTISYCLQALRRFSLFEIQLNNLLYAFYTFFNSTHKY